MFANLSRLFRYRGLIQALVARELKARYRGSVLGFLWSFINPLLLLSIYTFVFTVIIPNRNELTRPFAIFMFSGWLPSGPAICTSIGADKPKFRTCVVMSGAEKKISMPGNRFLKRSRNVFTYAGVE